MIVASLVVVPQLTRQELKIRALETQVAELQDHMGGEGETAGAAPPAAPAPRVSLAPQRRSRPLPLPLSFNLPPCRPQRGSSRGGPALRWSAARVAHAAGRARGGSRTPRVAHAAGRHAAGRARRGSRTPRVAHAAGEHRAMGVRGFNRAPRSCSAGHRRRGDEELPFSNELERHAVAGREFNAEEGRGGQRRGIDRAEKLA